LAIVVVSTPLLSGILMRGVEIGFCENAEKHVKKRSIERSVFIVLLSSVCRPIEMLLIHPGR